MTDLLVTDINGIVHDKCPRCNSKWIKITNYFQCASHHPNDNKVCVIAFEKYGQPGYMLHMALKYYGQPYGITYRKDTCLLTFRFDQKYKEIILPILPFNITAKKLQTYLTYV